MTCNQIHTCTCCLFINYKMLTLYQQHILLAVKIDWKKLFSLNVCQGFFHETWKIWCKFFCKTQLRFFHCVCPNTNKKHTWFHPTFIEKCVYIKYGRNCLWCWIKKCVYIKLRHSQMWHPGEWGQMKGQITKMTD